MVLELRMTGKMLLGISIPSVASASYFLSAISSDRRVTLVGWVWKVCMASDSKLSSFNGF